MAPVEVPVVELFRNHKRSLFLGTFVALVTFVLFYICSAWLLSYNVKVLQIPFLEFLHGQKWDATRLRQSPFAVCNDEHPARHKVQLRTGVGRCQI